MNTNTQQQPVGPTQSALERTFLVSNSMGLHLRPAQALVHSVTPLDCNVWISRCLPDQPREEVNGKSILGIAMLEAVHGTQLTVRVEGQDAERAMETIAELFESNFGEE